MMLKLAGAVMILVSSAVMGSCAANVYVRRAAAAEAVADFIKFIKRNVESFSMPVEEIFFAYTSEYFERTGFLDAIRSDGLSVAIAGGYLTLSRAAERELTEFAARLGSDCTDGEVKRCGYYADVFESLAKAERENAATNGRLCRLLPPLGAVSLIILLI